MTKEERAEYQRNYSKTYQHPNKEKRLQNYRNTKFKRKYGVTAVEYDQMVLDQGSKCYICELPFSTDRQDIKNRPVLDHDHITGANRKILCNKCNSMLGFAEDNIALLIKMISYLHEHK